MIIYWFILFLIYRSNYSRFNESLFAAFIDASKAFDVVWHESMLRTLFYTGISKETWIWTKMLYQDLHSKVKWEGKISRFKTF
jgi:hypothetical protein